MSSLRLIVASLVYHGRTNLAVALGAAAATAVLTGALLVGDSMRGSLRRLSLERLGRVDQVLVSDHFFRAALADELAADAGFRQHFDDAVPVILVPGSVEKEGRRAGRVQLIGCDGRFWRLGQGGPAQAPAAKQIVLNRTLAERLGAAVGDALIVHLPRPGDIPADSPLGRKEDTVQRQRVTVSAIIGDEGLGRFGLSASQQAPRNAYVPREWLAERLDQPGRASMILAASPEADQAPLAPVTSVLAAPWRPTLTDYGIRLRRALQGYFDLSSERMLLEPGAEKALLGALAGSRVQPALTYLANKIACAKRETPYSTITALDFAKEPPLGPMVSVEGKPIGPIGDNEIVLNAWTAEDLQARVGDTIRVTYFDPESSHGQVEERTAEFRLAAIARLEGPGADPGLTPEVRGVTDQRSIADWDAPFPFDARRIRPKDEKYWAEHRATPKAFVSLATGRRLWGSRFGTTTSLRVAPGASFDAAAWEKSLSLDPAALGMVFRPLKAQGLAASAGTTPFSVLFLGFSFFTIAAAVMLVALLFRLGTEARASQVGVLLAVGLRPRQVERLLGAEALVVVAAGSAAGTALGVGYAALMLAGLRTWWLEAISAPFLELCVSGASLAIGLASGMIVAGAAIGLSLRRIGRTPARRLLDGEIGTPPAGLGRAGRFGLWADVAPVAAIGAIVVGLLTIRAGETGRAVAFFVGAMGVLAAILTLITRRLRSGRTGPAVTAGRGNLVRLALRGAARNPGRSALGIGLVASATFLIVALSAFQVDPRAQLPDRDSGNGGFALVAECDQPIYENLNLPRVRSRLGLSPQEEKRLADSRIYALRVRPGDDASCRNLYQAQSPRVLGVPADLVARGGFDWAASAARTPGERENPWLLLNADLRGPDGRVRVPVVIDKNTAAYALHLEGGVGDVYRLDDGRGAQVEMEVVGLLANSILQGDLIVSEEWLLRLFPERTGYQFFLIDTKPEDAGRVGDALEDALAEHGLSAETSGQRLAAFMAIQNTYLSAFQSLGGLGLLLGTFGLAAVEMRNVLQRRRELALLRAVGFRSRALAGLVLFEAALVLVAGLAAGVLAAVVAVLPQLVYGGAAIPWRWLGVTLGLVLGVGVVASLAAVRAAVGSPVISALRNE